MLTASPRLPKVDGSRPGGPSSDPCLLRQLPDCLSFDVMSKKSKEIGRLLLIFLFFSSVGSDCVKLAVLLGRVQNWSEVFLIESGFCFVQRRSWISSGELTLDFCFFFLFPPIHEMKFVDQNRILNRKFWRNDSRMLTGRVELFTKFPHQRFGNSPEGKKRQLTVKLRRFQRSVHKIQGDR